MRTKLTELLARMRIESAILLNMLPRGDALQWLLAS